MKVLHVTPWYEPAWAAGGCVVSTRNFCRALSSLGVDVTVYATDDDGHGARMDVPLGEPVDVGGVKVLYFRSGPFGKWRPEAFSRTLSRKLAESMHRFDLVHVSLTRHWHGLRVSLLNRLSRVPYLLTPHGSLNEWFVMKVGKAYLKIPYAYLVDSRVARAASAVHYLCRGERVMSRRFGFGRPSFLVPNGIDLAHFCRRPEARTKLRREIGAADGTTVLLYVGRVHPMKNVHLVVEALGLLKDAGERVLFVVLGPTPDHGYLASLKERVTACRLEDSVRFLPPVPQEEVIDWYSAADILVLPSLVEGLSMSVIEALAASLPVLISRNAANASDVVKDGAGQAIDLTAESIASALLPLVFSGERIAELSYNARRSALARYDINKVADLMARAYRDVLTGSRDAALNWS
ncbi:MAG: glycosyltransferase [Deltaproteobacteria bacterium]|nr:glycosyltransferase [Deltaproteobacteria bacterium]